MKSVIRRPSFMLIFMMGCICFSASAQYDSIVHNSLNRIYLTHLPSGYTGNTPLSLVIAMHGGFGSAANLQDQSLLSVKADAEHFIVVYPEGVKNILGIRTWNAGWCCGYAATNNIDDVGFIDALIDTLLSQYNIDTTKIYATGMSNGGFMSYRLACELSHRIAAIAPVAASMSMPSCNPTRPVAIIQFHSYLDTSVPYLGGIGNGVSNHWNSPHDSVLNGWSMKNNCVNTNDTIIHDSLYTFIKWHPCDCNSEINYYITQDGGHSWPGGTATVIGDPVSVNISANDLMWDFFQLHTLNCDSTTSISESVEETQINIYPNPSNGIFRIFGNDIEMLHVFDLLGKEQRISVSQNNHEYSIELIDAVSGIYILNIINSNGISQQRRIVNLRM